MKETTHWMENEVEERLVLTVDRVAEEGLRKRRHLR